MHLHLCKPGFEPVLSKELSALGLKPASSGPGFVMTGAADDSRATVAGRLCFPTLSLPAAIGICATGKAALTKALADFALETFRPRRFDAPWPLVFACAPVDGLEAFTSTVAKSWREAMTRRMSRVMKLAVTGPTAAGLHENGLAVVLTSFDTAYVATRFVSGGQRRMKDDPGAPSRSYLKVEEAYAVCGMEPGKGDTVHDLGAAPGGWSYSAAKRGAKVIAVDNGPLKGAAASSLNINHLRADAFTYKPAGPHANTWLFCDMVEDPFRIVRLVRKWLENRWCDRFIVNLKIGQADPLRVIDTAGGADGIGPLCSGLIMRHLYHDRDEITMMGKRGAGRA